MEFITTSLLGSQRAAATGAAFRAVNAATGEPLEPEFCVASSADIESAATLATAAFATYGALDSTHKSRFLRAIADGMDAAKAAIAERAELETGLPPARLNGELARTTGQLRMFAALIEDGSWVEARLDAPDAERAPLPKPDLRSMLVPLGPVAVFGASNFPARLLGRGRRYRLGVGRRLSGHRQGASGASGHIRDCRRDYSDRRARNFDARRRVLDALR